MAALAGVADPVEDPFRDIIVAQQPGPEFNVAQIAALKRHHTWRE